MNIFVVDKNPKTAAEMLCDKHIVKMIIESCQMLSAAMDSNYKSEYIKPFLEAFGHEGQPPSSYYGCPQYPKAHMKHPCTLWVRESSANYKWLLKHLRGQCLEYRRRYNKVHKLEGLCMVYSGQFQYLEFEKDTLTPFVQAMPDRYKDSDPVKAYQSYYIYEKFPFAKWKMGNKPAWFYEPVVHVELEDAAA